MTRVRSHLMRGLREPLVHFLVIGATIFGVYGLTPDMPEDVAGDRIVVTATDVERLAGLWRKQWQRPPEAAELQGLTAEYVREEVLYREALALGLDRDDTVVRRRLAQKLEFLTEDLAAGREPTAAELAAYFDANRARYEVAPRLSFTQIYFSPERRGAAAGGDAEIVLASLRTGSGGAAPVEFGDRFMLDAQFRQQTPQEIAAAFGPQFADALLRLERGVWSGPVVSGYGLHLVRVEERIAPRVPALAEIEGQVRADWAYDQRRQANDAVYQRLLARYTVVIDADALDAAPPAMPGTDREAGQ